MEQHWPLLAVLSFVGGMLTISRVVHWVALLTDILRQSVDSKRMATWVSAVAPIFLHSGPWTMAIAAGALVFAANSSRADLWAVAGGLAAAAGVVGLSVLFSLLRRRHQPSKRQPLTPERLLVIRRRFFRVFTIAWAVVMSAIAYIVPGMPKSEREVLAVFAVLPALAGGWLIAWFMWQYYGEELKRIEKLRQLRESHDGV